MRYLTAGESHGPCLTAIVEGVARGLEDLRIADQHRPFSSSVRLRARRPPTYRARYRWRSSSRRALRPHAGKLLSRSWCATGTGRNWTDRMATFRRGLRPTSPVRSRHAPATPNLVGGGSKTDTSPDCRNILERASAARRLRAWAAGRHRARVLGPTWVWRCSRTSRPSGSASFKEDDALMNAPDYKPLAIETEARCAVPTNRRRRP